MDWLGIPLLILAARHGAIDEWMGILIRDRLSWLRFLDFSLGAPAPDRNMIGIFRERLTAAGAMEDLLVVFDHALDEADYRATGGQVVDSTLVPVPRQHHDAREREAIRAGRRKPLGKATQGLSTIAIPTFDYKNPIAIDRTYGFILRSAVTDTTCMNGTMLGHLMTCNNSGPEVWVDTARAIALEICNAIDGLAI